jgi:hypothetical protein
MANISPSGEAPVPVDPPKDAIENLFTYHAPTDEQKLHYVAIRSKAMELARLIDAHCPASPDRTTAIRRLRECVMTANAAIATGGGHYR